MITAGETGPPNGVVLQIIKTKKTSQRCSSSNYKNKKVLQWCSSSNYKTNPPSGVVLQIIFKKNNTQTNPK